MAKYRIPKAFVAGTRKQVRKTGNWKPREGKDNVFRILPPSEEAQRDGLVVPYLHCETHFKVGPDGRAVVCNEFLGQKCYICDQIAEIEGSGDYERAAELGASQTVYLVVIDMEDPEAGAQVWRSVPAGPFNDMLALMDRDDYGPTLCDDEEGFGLSMRREGTGMTTKYGSVIPDREPSALPVPLEKLAVPNILRIYGKVYTYEQQQLIWQGEECGPPTGYAVPGKSGNGSTGSEEDDDAEPESVASEGPEPGDIVAFERGGKQVEGEVVSIKDGKVTVELLDTGKKVRVALTDLVVDAGVTGPPTPTEKPSKKTKPAKVSKPKTVAETLNCYGGIADLDDPDDLALCDQCKEQADGGFEKCLARSKVSEEEFDAKLAGKSKDDATEDEDEDAEEAK